MLPVWSRAPRVRHAPKSPGKLSTVHNLQLDLRAPLTAALFTLAGDFASQKPQNGAHLHRRHRCGCRRRAFHFGSGNPEPKAARAEWRAPRGYARLAFHGTLCPVKAVDVLPPPRVSILLAISRAKSRSLPPPRVSILLRKSAAKSRFGFVLGRPPLGRGGLPTVGKPSRSRLIVCWLRRAPRRPGGF